jgi:hypothetical protein
MLFININSIAVCHSEGSRSDSINEGPYIFYANKKLAVKWIENGLLLTDYVDSRSFAGTKEKFNLLVDYNDLMNTRLLKPDYTQFYDDVDSIAAISDIHGEYDSYINLMKSVGIIDDNLKWKFGSGHLVVLGDLFDRGNMVTEVLWHLFGLENQALKAGGMVHVLLGNHEILMLYKNLKYTNAKYNKVEAISGIDYSNLYSEESVLGTWLRNQPAVISINDILFVHGGVSNEMVRRRLKVVQINRIISDMAFRKEIESDKEFEDLKFLIKEHGPFFYRGYFEDKSFCESRIDSILTFYNKDHIVVGHTPSNEIQSIFDNRIIGIQNG